MPNSICLVTRVALSNITAAGMTQAFIIKRLAGCELGFEYWAFHPALLNVLTRNAASMSSLY